MAPRRTYSPGRHHIDTLVAAQFRTAHFPQITTLEDFNLDHVPSLRRDVLAHLATGTFIYSSAARARTA
nr:hypothetical protein [Frankia sp. Cas4]